MSFSFFSKNFLFLTIFTQWNFLKNENFTCIVPYDERKLELLGSRTMPSHGPTGVDWSFNNLKDWSRIQIRGDPHDISNPCKKRFSLTKRPGTHYYDGDQSPWFLLSVSTICIQNRIHIKVRNYTQYSQCYEQKIFRLIYSQGDYCRAKYSQNQFR